MMSVLIAVAAVVLATPPAGLEGGGVEAKLSLDGLARGLRAPAAPLPEVDRALFGGIASPRASPSFRACGALFGGIASPRAAPSGAGPRRAGCGAMRAR